ncbi:SDR family oxidoreductase [Novosphingobium album (ex Liu et al. 2023)]|uniref:SDR family NAD(P)-dependent oxidoreductase n=1 Tax=Novosphingobium album (ex Liu et al. 2023) TaxID=3031130 RepID=A0ABT5WX97_9SPHN|nr:SDR family NAD(P)-dependent oxidoreductase [Novosphingobium album (ex Liu et al. 2023)]MDE8654526.1 SDR family NAD(P)-dependent oxidoreductase [Novosphingobium album (ex Liu et al. 2023)]
MQDLAGKVAFITGGAGGLGFGMAEAFAEAGMRIVISDIDGERLERAVANLATRGVAALGIAFDITDRAAWDDAVGRAVDRFGAVHVLCNNAGITAVGWEVDQIAPDLWDLVIATNLTATFNGARAVLPVMKAQGEGGHIVNTASISGLRARAGHAVYVAAKHGVVGLSETLRLELAPHGIGVSVLCPGHVPTPLPETSRRLRAAVEGSAPRPVAEVLAGAPTAIDALGVGRMVRDAVMADRLFVLTHPEFRDVVGERHREVMDAFAIAAARA